MLRVVCLDDGKHYWFDALTPMEAMRKMKYTLDCKYHDKNAVINKTETGTHLYMEHGGKTYAIYNGNKYHKKIN